MSARGTARRVGVLGVLSLALALLPSMPAQAADPPSAVCTSGLTNLDRQLGGHIPLPSRFSNPTSSTVRFTMRIAGSYFFGPARDVGSVTLPGHFGRTYAGTIPTFLRTPIGVGVVLIEVRTDRTGNQVVARCEYKLRLAAPPPVNVGPPWRPVHRWTIQVPVQMCAIEGSDLAGAATPGQTVRPGPFLDLLAAVNDTVWHPQAQIAFSTATDSAIPVIRDPSPPNRSNGRLGDLDNVGDPFYPEAARDLCRQEWRTRFAGRIGIPLINARSFVDSGATLGVAPKPPNGLYVAGSRHFGSGTRGDALCGSPVRLNAADLSNVFVVVPDQSRIGSASPVKNVAHELGHTLFLGHGNGLDDDGDGRPPGFTGPRRYDEYCDPGWLEPPTNEQVAEDVGSPTPYTLQPDAKLRLLKRAAAAAG